MEVHNKLNNTIAPSSTSFKTPDQYYAVPYLEYMYDRIVAKESPKKAMRVLQDLADSKDRKICALYPYLSFAETKAEYDMLVSQVNDLCWLMRGVPKFKIPCSWEVFGLIEIEADSLEEAIDLAYDEIGLPDDSSYIEDSFTVDSEGAEAYN